MAGQSTALALAQTMLEHKRVQAEKLRQSRAVLEEEERVIQEQVHIAEQLVASLGGVPTAPSVASDEHLPPPPGFEPWAQTPPGISPPTGARGGQTQWRSAVDSGARPAPRHEPCVLWLGYPRDGVVRAEAELQRMCNSVLEGKGCVLSVKTRFSRRGVPCQFVELSTPEAADAAKEHLKKVLPERVAVQYSEARMERVRSMQPTPMPSSPRRAREEPPEAETAAEEPQARTRTRETDEEGGRPRKRQREETTSENAESRAAHGTAGISRKGKEQVPDGDESEERRGRSSGPLGEDEAGEESAKRKKVRDEKRGSGAREEAEGSKERRRREREEAAESERAAALEREKRERKERRRQEKARAAEEAAAAAAAEEKRRRKEEKRAAAKEKEAIAAAETAAERNRRNDQDRAGGSGSRQEVDRRQPHGESTREVGSPPRRPLPIAGPSTPRAGNRSRAQVTIDLVSQVGKRVEVPVPGRAAAKYFAPIRNSKMRDIKWSAEDHRTFFVNQHNGRLATWTVTDDGWGLEEGPAVPVLNSVQKWVENFAPFDAHQVAVVYTPPLKKETTAPGEQLGMVDLQSHRITFARDSPHARGAFCVTTVPGSPTATRLATGGLRHEVVGWSVLERNSGPVFRPTSLHSCHSACVSHMAVLRHRPTLVSAGLDGRIVAYDLQHQQADELVPRRSRLPVYRALQNPVDPNLLLLQIGKPGLQYELRDLRVPGPVLSCFGWRPVAKVQQGPASAGSWSPGGVLIASGSTDPKIHLFDIRKRCDSPLVSLDVDKKTKTCLWYRGGSVLITSTAKNNSLCLSRLNL